MLGITQHVEQMVTEVPKGLGVRAAPKPMKHSLVLLEGAHRAILVDMGGDAPSPHIHGNGFMPKLPN
jgi:hypothetical protein